MEKIKVVLLAGGVSRRMQPVKDKNFLDFCGKPLVQWQLDMLRGCGFEDVVIVGRGHNLERLKGLGVEVVEQTLDTGMHGAVMAAREQISEGPVMIVSGNDVVDEAAFESVRQAFEADGEASYLVGKKVNEYFPGGYLEVDQSDVINGIVEKPGAGNEPSDLVNLVVHLHKDGGELVSALEEAESEADDLYEVAIDNMIKQGATMRAVEYDGFWQPIKFPWHVQKVFRHLLGVIGARVDSSAEIAEDAIVKGDVIIGKGVRIMEGAVISGPVYIGDNSVVANNALVRDSHIGANCVVGFGTEVARSYLAKSVWTHSNYIGDSVIGNNVSFGAGTVTGNLRLDEKNIRVGEVDCGSAKCGLITGDDIRVGINVSFMPGVKLGSGSSVAGGIVVGQDIPEKSFVRGTWELKISENRDDISDIKR